MKKISIILALLLCLTSCQPFASKKSFQKTQDVFYEIFVASFQDSDGDGVGDLKGIVEKLDYLDALGVTGLWLMPIHPSNSYHKYDVKDYYAIDPSYGKLEDFDFLIEEAKKRNIKIIIDLVLNHSSDQHPWFIEAQNQATCKKTCDFYHFSSKAQAGYAPLRENLYYEARFSPQMPDLNLENEQLKKEIESIARFWLNRGVSGFRLDAVAHFFEDKVEQSVAFTQWFKNTVKAIRSDAFLVGEVWKSEQALLPYYKSGIDALFDFDGSELKGRFVRLGITGKGEELAKQTVEYTQKIKAIQENAVNAIFISNHDQGRSAGYLNTLEKQKLIASLYLLSPGIPFIYYGEEIGMKGSGKDENKRLAMPWGENHDAKSPQNSDYVSKDVITVKEALQQEHSLLKHYQEVLRLRHLYVEGSSIPDVLELNPAVFALKYSKHSILVNTSKETVHITLAGELIDHIGEVSQKGESLTLPAFSVAILES